MKWPVTRWMVLLACVAGCAYEPPVRDRAAPAYQADLQACQGSVPAAVDTRNAKTGLAWLGSPVRRPFQVRAGMRECMAGKGHAVSE